jgi:hypothetical protein
MFMYTGQGWVTWWEPASDGYLTVWWPWVRCCLSVSRFQLWCTCTDLAFLMVAGWTGRSSGDWCPWSINNYHEGAGGLTYVLLLYQLSWHLCTQCCKGILESIGRYIMAGETTCTCRFQMHMRTRVLVQQDPMETLHSVALLCWLYSREKSNTLNSHFN